MSFDKVAIFSDVHFGVDRNSEERLRDAYAAVEWMVAEATQAGAPACVFAGDWFHHRDEIDVRTAKVAREAAELVASSFERFYLVAGNHDFYYNNSPSVSSASMLGGIEGLEVVSEGPSSIEVGGRGVLLAPWFTKLDGLPRYDAMIGHFEFVGGRMAGGYSKVGCSPSDLVSVAPLVFTGHYHLTDDREVAGGRIVTVGSLYQQDWGDAGDRKRFILFDGSSFTSVYNDRSPKFLSVPYSKLAGLPDEKVAALFMNEAFKGATVRISSAAGEASHERLARLVEIASSSGNVRSASSSGDAAGSLIVESVEEGLEDLASKDVRSYVSDFVEESLKTMTEYAGIDPKKALKEVSSYFDRIGSQNLEGQA